MLGPVAKGTAAGVVADFITSHPDGVLLADLVQNSPDFANPLTEALASKPGDSPYVKRGRHALEGALIGGAVGGVLKAGSKGVAAAAPYAEKATRKTLEAAGLRASRAEAAAQGKALGGSNGGAAPQHSRNAGGSTDTGGRGKDFTDYRSDAEMKELHQDLLRIKATADDYLYMPRAESAPKTFYAAERLSKNIYKDSGVRSTPIEVSPGTWKLRVDSIPPGPSLPEVQRELRDVYRRLWLGEDGTAYFGIIGPEEAARIKAKTGVDVLLCKRTLSIKQADHPFLRHGNEEMRGQISITEEDFVRYAELIYDPHHIRPGHNKGSIIFERRYPDGTVYAVEQKIVKGNTLEFRTMWKQSVGGAKILILSSSIRDE